MPEEKKQFSNAAKENPETQNQQKDTEKQKQKEEQQRQLEMEKQKLEKNYESDFSQFFFSVAILP